MALLEAGVWKLRGIRREVGKGNFHLLSNHENVRLIFFGGPETGKWGMKVWAKVDVKEKQQ
jgi:hypothetical protein